MTKTSFTPGMPLANLSISFTWPGSFMICALALMGGQDHQAVGVEWLVVSSLSAVIYVNGYVQAIRRRGSSAGLHPSRLVGGTACHLAEMAGAVVLALGHIAGLYVAAVALIIYFGFLISGAWLLLVAVYEDRADTQTTQ